jgi:hypothetical protein
MTPTLLTENMTLNSRSTGALINTVVMLSVFQYIDTRDLLWLLLSLFAGAMLLLTHKLSTQSLAVTLLFLGVVEKDIRYVFLLPGIILVAFAISAGFYYKVLLAHLDILLFWRRNLHNLRTHHIFDSPLYNDGTKGSELFHQSGWKGVLRHLQRLLGHNFALVPFILVPFLGNTLDHFFWWAIEVYIIVFVTTFWGPARFLGEGYKYIKLAAFPLAYILSVSLVSAAGIDRSILAILISGMLMANLAAMASVYRSVRLGTGFQDATIPIEMRIAADRIQHLAGQVVCCLPLLYADYISYQTGKDVLWGTHSGGFRLIEDFFPVLKKPLEYFLEKYEVDFLVLDSRYVSPDTLRLNQINVQLVDNINGVLIYQVLRQPEGTAVPKVSTWDS